MEKINSQKLFNKIQEEIDALNRVEAEGDSDCYILITLSEARYLAELISRYEVPEMLEE